MTTEDAKKGFEHGKCYEHPSGMVMRIVGKGTVIDGDVLLAQTNVNQDLRAVRDLPGTADNWTEIDVPRYLEVLESSGNKMKLIKDNEKSLVLEEGKKRLLVAVDKCKEFVEKNIEFEQALDPNEPLPVTVFKCGDRHSGHFTISAGFMFESYGWTVQMNVIKEQTLVAQDPI